MKIQIIKIIPCLLAGFILSACVGAVNIPSEIADKVIKTTDPDPVIKKTAVVIIDDKEPEPIVVDPEVALINRCIMDDNLKDSSCTPIVSEHPCITNPFGVACDITFTDYYKTAQANRITFCNDNTGDSLCTGDYVADICDYDLFSKVCGDSYNKPREIVCGDEPQSPRCTNTISRVCDDDMFHTLCDTHAIYEPTRTTHCITNDNSVNAGCKRVFATNSCVLNPFGAGCDTQAPARTMRESFCRESDNSANPVCVGAVLSLCGDDPFDRLCGESYQPQRDIIIADCIMIDNADKPKCESAVNDNYCIKAPFESYSNCRRTLSNYYEVARENRKAYCNVADTAISGKNICRGAVRNICNSDPFDVACATGFVRERAIRTGYCGENDNALNDRCMNAIKQNLCIREPFGAGCDNHYTPRNNRISFCIDDTMESSLCTQPVRACISNPFTDDCNFHALNNLRNMNVDFCIRVNNINNNKCDNAVTANPCITTPFADDCYNRRSNFANYYENARNNRISFCSSSGNANDSLCNGAVERHPCIKNPFALNCDADINFRNHRETARENRIEFCNGGITENNLCNSLNACLANPFSSDCSRNAFENNRKKIISGCIVGGMASSEGCISAVMENSCIADPFAVNCSRVSYYQTARDNRIVFCSDTTKRMHGDCTVVNFCNINPFGADCFSDRTYDNSRNKRITLCGFRNNADNDECKITLSRPNTATWLQSFETPLPRTNTSKIENKFLQGGQGARVGFNSVQGSVNFGYRKDESFTPWNYFHSASISSNTDLGAPLTGPNRTTTWNGRIGFSTVSSSGSVRDFTLTVNFGAGSQAGTISAFVPIGNLSYSLTGRFDNNGVITGDTEYRSPRLPFRQLCSTMRPGVLTGLIGQEGAVGAFISNQTGSCGYSGGFVASPPAE